MKTDILLDVDGVLLDWVTPFEKHLSRMSYRKIAHKYSIEESHGLTNESAQWHLHHFNTSLDIASLQPILGAVDAVRELVDHGFCLDIVSSISEDPRVHVLRKFNLLNVFGDVFGKYHFLPCGSHKREILSQYEPCWFIEDKPENTDDATRLGHRAILLNQKYNEHCFTLGPRFDTWSQIRNHILDERA